MVALQTRDHRFSTLDYLLTWLDLPLIRFIYEYLKQDSSVLIQNQTEESKFFVKIHYLNLDKHSDVLNYQSYDFEVQNQKCLVNYDEIRNPKPALWYFLTMIIIHIA